MRSLEIRNENMTNRIGNLLRDFDPAFCEVFSPVANKTSEESMPVKIIEHENEFELEAVLPGVSREDIEVSYENDTLAIKAEYKAEKKKEGSVVIWDERSAYCYARSFTIIDLNIDKADASLKNGVLKITLPKTESTKPKQISIK